MNTTIKFSKDWLVKLAATKPETRVEFKDTENRFLRAIHHPSGMVKLFVYKCPRGLRQAVRVALPFTVTDSMPNIQRIRTEANKIILQLDEGQNPNQIKAVTKKRLTLRKALDNYLDGSTNTERVDLNWRRSIENHLAE